MSIRGAPKGTLASSLLRKEAEAFVLAAPQDMRDWYLARLMRRVEKSETCWHWQGAKDLAGYGVTSIKMPNGRHILVKTHRLSYLLHEQDRILTGRFVCHRCDTPACLRPDHLFVGTPRDNWLDMQAKNRGVSIEAMREGWKRKRALGLLPVPARNFGNDPELLRKAIANSRAWFLQRRLEKKLPCPNDEAKSNHPAIAAPAQARQEACHGR